MELRNNSPRARTAIATLWLTLASEVLMIAYYLLGHTMYKSGSRDLEFFEKWFLVEGALGVFQIVVIVVTAITFIMWFRRAYFNLHTKVQGLNYGEGWAAGAWFVPFLNLYRPYQIGKELFERTQLFLSDENGKIYEQKWQSNLSAWWGLWITANILSRIGSRLEPMDNVTVSSSGAIVFYAGAAILFTVAAFYAIKVVKGYNELEEEMYQTDMNDTLLPEN